MTILNEPISAKLLKSFVPVLNVGFSALVIGPIMITYWVSSWELYDFYLKSNDPNTSTAISLAIGFGGQFLLMFYQDTIAKLFIFKNHKWLSLIISKIFVTLYAQIDVNLWRGTWSFLDLLAPAGNTMLIINILKNFIILIASETYMNLFGPPLAVATDEDILNNFKVRTYFKREVSTMMRQTMMILLIFIQFKKADGTWRYICDIALTMLIVLIVVTLYHDLYTLIDTNLLTGDTITSAYASLVSVNKFR